MRKVRVVQLLACDPGLGNGLTADELAVASQALPVQLVTVRKGPWHSGANEQEPGHLGYLVIRGLLVRRVEVAAGSSVELLGQGDLLRPWQEDVSSLCAASWEVLEPTALVPLGPKLAQVLSRWPAIVSNLIARAIRRSRAVAADAAISSIVGLDQRLLALLWRIAETWGEMKEDGVHISVRLPHRLLAELVAARRPSVTSALMELQESGRLTVTPSGGWILNGEPPC